MNTHANTAENYNRAAPYDPEDPRARRALALAIQKRLQEAGFYRDHTARAKEEVWMRPTPHPQLRIVVYTTIEGPAVRKKAKDAVRVRALYKRVDGQERPIVKEQRIFRTGTIDSFIDRLITRCRDAYTRAAKPPRCTRCGAPLFVSKKGKDVCAEACWEKRQ